MLPSTASHSTRLQNSHLNLKDCRIFVVMPSIPIQGMERANLQIMKMVRERGADILFITEKNHGKSLQLEIEQIGCRWRPVAVINSFEERLHLSMKPLEMFLVLVAWVKASCQIFLAYLCYRPTHIYLTNLSYVLYSLPILASTKRPVIFRVPNPPELGLSGWKQSLSNWIWKALVAKKCTLIVCNSEYTRLQLLRAGIPPEKIKIVRNCVPERNGLAVNDSPEIPQGLFNIVYLGQIRREKGIQELFDCARKIVSERNDVNFYLVGEHKWKNDFAENLISQLEKGGLSERIRMIGPIQDINGILKQAQLLVCPSISRSESFPNVVLEAKNHGVPAVVFDTAGLPEAVTHLEDGFICATASSEGLYEGVAYFLQNPERLKNCGLAAKKSLERFSRETASEQWSSIFQATLKPSKP